MRIFSFYFQVAKQTVLKYFCQLSYTHSFLINLIYLLYLPTYTSLLFSVLLPNSVPDIILETFAKILIEILSII